VKYIGVSFNVVECVLTFWRWVFLAAVSCVAVINVCGSGSVLYRMNEVCVLRSSV
jgi:hypothetical protein